MNIHVVSSNSLFHTLSILQFFFIFLWIGGQAYKCYYLKCTSCALQCINDPPSYMQLVSQQLSYHTLRARPPINGRKTEENIHIDTRKSQWTPNFHPFRGCITSVKHRRTKLFYAYVPCVVSQYLLVPVSFVAQQDHSVFAPWMKVIHDWHVRDRVAQIQCHMSVVVASFSLKLKDISIRIHVCGEKYKYVLCLIHWLSTSNAWVCFYLPLYLLIKFLL